MDVRRTEVGGLKGLYWPTFRDQFFVLPFSRHIKLQDRRRSYTYTDSYRYRNVTKVVAFPLRHTLSLHVYF